VVETCTRTIHGLPLLSPGPEANERILGALGRAAEYYEVDLYGFGFCSTHYHLLYGVEHGLQMSRFQGHLNSNLAREIGRLHGWREKFWGRRYRPMAVGDDRESQRERLKYVLSQPVKDGLVERVLQWPGPNAARALVDGKPLVGHWFNRTKEHYARRKGVDFDKYDYATRYEIELQRLPAYRADSSEEYRAMIVELLWEIEEEGAAKRKGRKVLGVEKVLAQDPCQPVGISKKSPASPLFFSKQPGVHQAMTHDYRDFEDHYVSGSARMVEAAERGYRLDPRRHLPDGSVPPAVVEAILQASAGFNPEAAFPQRSFPRAWPFFGGELPPPPPQPPTRRLVVHKVSETWKIVWRGEIPTVHFPRRADTGIPDETVVPAHLGPMEETQCTYMDPARDPP
jgi:hypothetical protein